jgi:hypothetical protein
MKHLTSAELKEIALDIEVELGQLARLRAEIERVNHLLDTSPELADIFMKTRVLSFTISTPVASGFFGSWPLS